MCFCQALALATAGQKKLAILHRRARGGAIWPGLPRGGLRLGSCHV